MLNSEQPSQGVGSVRRGQAARAGGLKTVLQARPSVFDQYGWTRGSQSVRWPSPGQALLKISESDQQKCGKKAPAREVFQTKRDLPSACSTLTFPQSTSWGTVQEQKAEMLPRPGKFPARVSGFL